MEFLLLLRLLTIQNEVHPMTLLTFDNDSSCDVNVNI